MKKNKLLITIGAAVLIGIIGYNIREQLLGRDNTIKIGVLSFMTGTYAQMGNDLANGILLAKDEYETNANNSIKVELKVEDGKAEGKTSASAFARLQQWGLKGAIIAGDNQVPTVAPVIERDNIPTVATIISNSRFIDYNANGVWIFRNWISVTAMAESMAYYAVDKLHLATVAILKMRSEYGDEAEAAFGNVFSKDSGRVLSVESFNETDADARTIISKTIAMHPEAVYVAGYGSCYGVVLNQLRECGFRGIILTGDAVMNPETRGQIKDAHSIYFARFMEPTDSAYDAFKMRYKERFGREASVYSAYGYDSFNILISGFKDRKMSAEDVRNSIMERNTYKTLLGTVKFKSNGDCSIPVAVQLMGE